MFSMEQIQVQVASAFSVFCAFIFPEGLVHLSMITFFLSSSSPFKRVSHACSCSLSQNVIFLIFFSSSFADVFSVF